MRSNNANPGTAGGAGSRPLSPPHRARRYLLDLLITLLGSLCYALSVNVFTAPNHIAPGGVTGAATLINYLTGAPIGTTILIINIPLLAAAWKFIGRTYTLKTAVATVVVSVIIDTSALFLPAFRGDTMLVAVFGGVLAGAGLGLIYMRGATTGGSEIVAGLLERRLPHIPIGRLILLVDAVVVACSAVVYKNLESALYAMVLIFVSSSLMDTLIYGQHKGKMLLIMTRREREVADDMTGWPWYTTCAPPPPLPSFLTCWTSSRPWSASAGCCFWRPRRRWSFSVIRRPGAAILCWAGQTRWKRRFARNGY